MSATQSHRTDVRWTRITITSCHHGHSGVWPSVFTTVNTAQAEGLIRHRNHGITYYYHYYYSVLHASIQYVCCMYSRNIAPSLTLHILIWRHLFACPNTYSVVLR